MFSDFEDRVALTEILRLNFNIHRLRSSEVQISPIESVLRFDIKKDKLSKNQYLDIEYMNFHGNMTEWIMKEFSKEIPPYLI